MYFYIKELFEKLNEFNDDIINERVELDDILKRDRNNLLIELKNMLIILVRIFKKFINWLKVVRKIFEKFKVMSLVNFNIDDGGIKIYDENIENLVGKNFDDYFDIENFFYDGVIN